MDYTKKKTCSPFSLHRLHAVHYTTSVKPGRLFHVTLVTWSEQYCTGGHQYTAKTMHCVKYTVHLYIVLKTITSHCIKL